MAGRRRCDLFALDARRGKRRHREALLWALFLVLSSAYLATLWGEAVRARARLFVATLVVGFIALAVTGVGITSGESVALDALAALNVVGLAAALGGVTSGMLIGHWYLIDPGMEIEPFHKCFGFSCARSSSRWSSWSRCSRSPASRCRCPSPGEALNGYWQLAGMRFLLGPVAALGIAALTARVLAIPQTMAATGLFYIATLAVLVGSFLGRYFTFRTGLPF